MAEVTVKIATVGPPKRGTSKSSGKPYVVYELQFEDDPQWYGTFWSKKEDPEVGMELKGEKSYDEEYKSYNFKIAYEGGQRAYNPAAANATVWRGAVALVHDWLSLDPANLAKWQKSIPEDKDPFEHYVETINKTAAMGKLQVASMGPTEVQAPASTTQTPPKSAVPGAPVTSVLSEGEQEVDTSFNQ